MMRLYIWTDVLVDYTSGMVCAVAESEKQAKELAVEELLGKRSAQIEQLKRLRDERLALQWLDRSDEEIARHVDRERANDRKRWEAELDGGSLEIDDIPSACHCWGGS